ncbi:MAG TPA: hypothetical protein DEB40_13325 [Elusimicrobia bacterium]|nr:hypothetical protein [Elusimicrobiota bacterium]HBT62716.1 hypothetical protein [Elusimicrobiota bacterium]
MRKVKGFKIVLRPAEIKRRAKKAGLDVAAMGLDDPALGDVLAEAAKAIVPGVLYETFKQPDPDAPALSPIPGLAYSLVLATLGPGFGASREAARAASAEMYALWGLIEETALDEAVRFATSLLEQEAAKESCVLSPLSALQDAAVLETVVRKLDGSKLEIRLHEGRLDPAPSGAVSLSWVAQSKSRGKPKK